MRACAYSFSGNLAVYATDKAMGYPCEMFVIDPRTMGTVCTHEDNICRMSINGPRISSVLWGALDETLITGHEDGALNIWDSRV